MGGGGGGQQLLLQAPGLLQGGVQALARIITTTHKASQLAITSSRSSSRSSRSSSYMRKQLTSSPDLIVVACRACSRGPNLRSCRQTGKKLRARERVPARRRRRGEFYHVVACSSAESGIAETVSDPAPSLSFQHASDGHGSDAGGVEDQQLQFYTEAGGIEVVRSLEEAEKEVLKAVSELDHDQTTAAPLNALELLPEEEEEEEEEEESEEAAEAHEEMAAAAAAAAEEQNLVGEQFHLLRTLEQPTSAVAAAVMVAQVAEALKEADEQQQLESQEEEDEDEDEAYVSTSSTGQQEQEQQQQLVHVRVQELVPGKGMLAQMWDIIVFAGPALGIWLSGPIMSLIDTSVIGQSSSLELAALGPGTVLCDNLCYVFMFLSVATSNLIATALAQKDEAEAAGHLSRLLFVAVTCGIAMAILTQFGVDRLLQGFVGVENADMIPAARVYVQIRALAWPAVLVGLVSQSASLGMQDSWGPLKSLAIASGVNLTGDILLCTVMGYGIAGAAWATMASQYVAAYLMMKSLHDRGYNVMAISSPSWKEFVHMVNLAAPILLTMISKVTFYTLITYLATTLGAIALAAHQVMVGICYLCSVWGEPLAQTAQSFMPAFIHGTDRNLKQARSLLGLLMLMGVIVGFSVGCMAISVPWFFPQIFTKDLAIIAQMQSVTLPLFCSLVITPPTHALEGTLLAGRDMRFLGLSMTACFCGGSIVLLARFLYSYARLSSSQSILRDPIISYEAEEPVLTPT
ncbi:hypothetical protein CY35_19G025700 [Sphagnum magellanicum]|nr:hypothetical protein CY35_19G025700 [Sphagnum magellanicum]